MCMCVDDKYILVVQCMYVCTIMILFVFFFFAVGSLSGETEYRLTYKFLVKMVLSRCSDKAPRYYDIHVHVHVHVHVWGGTCTCIYM